MSMDTQLKRRGAFPAAMAGLLLLGLASGLSGEEYAAGAAILFRGTSSLHDFEGHVATQPFKIILRDGDQDDQVVMDVAVEVVVADMGTQNDKRDRNMFKMLESPKFSLIRGSVTDLVVAKKGDTTVSFPLTIRDQTHLVDATLSGWTQTEEGVSFDLALSVSLEGFGLKPPSVLGFIRVGDRVDVQCTVTLAKTNDQTITGPKSS